MILYTKKHNDNIMHFCWSNVLLMQTKQILVFPSLKSKNKKILFLKLWFSEKVYKFMHGIKRFNYLLQLYWKFNEILIGNTNS